MSDDIDDVSNKRVISILFRETLMPDAPGEILEEPGVKAVSFITSPVTDENFLKILGFLSQFCGGVSLWNGKMIIPAKNEPPGDTRPPDGEMN